MGRCRRRRSSAFTCFSLARSLFLMVTRRSQKRPSFVFPHMCVKPKIERLRLDKAPLLSVRRREAAELDQASLVRVQLQVELREPFAKIVEEPFCITEILEPDDEVVGEPGDDHVAPGVPAP